MNGGGKVSWGLGRRRLITKRERDMEANEEHSVNRRGSVWETRLSNQVLSSFPSIMIDVDPCWGVLQADCARLSIKRGWLWVLIHCKLKLKTADFKWFGNRVWWWMNIPSKSQSRRHHHWCYTDDLKCLESKAWCKLDVKNHWPHGHSHPTNSGILRWETNLVVQFRTIFSAHMSLL